MFMVINGGKSKCIKSLKANKYLPQILGVAFGYCLLMFFVVVVVYYLG